MLKPVMLFCAVSVLTATFAPTTHAAPVKKKPAAHKPTVGTLGTKQMAGGDGVFGETYTLKGGPNFTLVSAEYSVTRLDLTPTSTIVPKADEKLLILHLRFQNPRKEDMYLSRNSVTFASVAGDNTTRDGINDMRLVSRKASLSDTLKPGQRFPEEVITALVVPASGPVPKLIMNTGREGTNEEVTRFALGTGKNKVAGLPAPYADSSDPSGATALTEIPAQIGTTYTTGSYDMSVTAIAYADGPIGETTAADGKRFLIVTVTATNKTLDKNYFNSIVGARLYTADDEHTDDMTVLKGKRDEPFEGYQMDPDESGTVRLAFQVPKDTTGKKLRLFEQLDNSGDVGRAFIYDLSNIK